jgi:putative transcriptional regulator
MLYNLKGSDKLQTRIQDLRKERKITQGELADAVNVTRQTIISLENGRYNASLILAHKIAQFFGVSIEDIFIFNEEDENLSITLHLRGEGL